MDNIKTQIRQQRLLKAQLEAQAAQLKLNLLTLRFRPSLNLPVRIYREGGHWTCVMETSEDMLECCVAYGDSPNQAAVNFDYLWLGLGIPLAHAAIADAEQDEDYDDGDNDDEDEDDEDEDDEDLDTLINDDDDDGEEW